MSQRRRAAVPNAVVEDYVRERDRNLNTINVLLTTAKSRGDDPSTGDLESIEKLKARNKEIDRYIAVIGDDLEMSQDLRDKLSKVQPGIVPTAPKYRSAGELLWDCVHANYGTAHSHDDQDARSRWDLVMKRAAQHMGTTAEATTPVAGGFGGLVVAPVVGPIIDIAPAGQPLLTALGKQPAPNALNFTRPRLVDPDLKTGAAAQALQKAELVSKKFDVVADTLSLSTVGGYLNVSQQLMSFQPGAWDIIVSQLQRRVAWQGEALGVAELSRSTAHIPLAAGADSATVLAALFDGAKLVYDTTFELPTWIAYGPGGWAMLGKLTDAAGRPLFPFLGAANAFGTGDLGSFGLGPLGLQQVVTPGITTNDIWIGNSYGMETYSYAFPVLEAVEPSVMGRQVAVAEALAFYRPTTKEAVTGGSPAPAEGNGAVRIGP
jgi:hypothetical protein